MDLQTWQDDVATWMPYALANDAGCQCPDTQKSPGAEFLMRVRDALVEAVSCGRIYWQGEAASTDGAQEDRGDVISEIADDMPSVYTYPRWQAFTDLCAWEVSPDVIDDFGATSDLTDHAGHCLTRIAETLLYALCADLDERCGTDGDDDDMEGEA